jgi:hypothetical protein
MGAFALGRRAFRGAFGAGFLALVLAFPTASEAHLNAFQGAQFATPRTDTGKDCSPGLPGRAWIRGPGICPESISAPVVVLQRMVFSGKVDLAVAIGLYCRTSVDLSEFTRQDVASLQTPSPPQRLIGIGNEATEWPAGRFDPAADTGVIDAFPRQRLPDG